MSSPEFHCGYVALIGKPNVGKSTLMNAIVGTKLSIVSAKPQTTRRKVIGFYNDKHHQMIYVDTPGIITPKYLLQKAMMESTLQALQESDVFVILVDAQKSIEHRNSLPPEIVRILPSLHRPVFLALNKIDLVKDKKLLLPLIGKCCSMYSYHAIIPISALKHDSLDVLLKQVGDALPLHPPLYPVDILSEHPVRFFVGEIIREKIFDAYREEIPYSTAVDIVIYEERDAGKDFISAEILVERETQRKILIGDNGAALKRVGTDARKDIEIFLQRKVFLELYVKVREGWRDNATWLKNLGYEIY